MKILAIADLHGNLPEIEPCDILLVGGDVCQRVHHGADHQIEWLSSAFYGWLKSVPAKYIVGIAGNHDFAFEKRPEAVASIGLPWVYLQDDLIEIEGLRIYGTPWTPNLPYWAFHGGMNNRCGSHFDHIPDNVDILLSHGPMYLYADQVLDGYRHAGCKAMADYVWKSRPLSFVCGHIHEGYGHYRHPHVEHGVFNVSYVNERYEPVHEAVDVSFPG